MTSGKFFRSFFFVMILAALAQAVKATPMIDLHLLSPLAKAPRELPDDAFLAVHGHEPIIHAAWGESEALQLLVCARDGDLRNLRVEIGEFVHESGDAWGGADPEAALRADFVGYVTTEEPYYGTLHVGDWADPLLPDESVDIVAGQSQAIWVEVTVPLDAEAGGYHGEIRLVADGWSTSVPLSVEVWGFDLPADPVLPSSFLLYPRYVYQYHGLEKGDAAADAMLQRYYESMLAHRIMPTHVAMDPIGTRPLIVITDDGKLKDADFAAFDRQVEWAQARGQTHFGLEGPRKIDARGATWYRVMAGHLREKGWLDRFYTYLVDETFDGVAEVTAMVGSAAPDLKNLITMLPEDGYPHVGLWCPRLGDAMMNAAAIDAWLAERGLTRADMWTYTAGNAGSDVPALHLDVPGLEVRQTPLAVWLEDYGGFLFWSVNYWTVDPWADPMVYPRQNGNGTLYYPGPDGPLPSIRLKMLRDGFDDVDYAQLLRAADVELADEILGLLPLRSALDRDIDPRTLLGWRLAAGYYLAGDEDLAAGWAGKLSAAREIETSKGLPLLDVKNPESGWHGGRRQQKVGGDDRRVLRFTLDEDKDKLWRMPSPSDWRAYRELVIELELVAGDPVHLNLKLGSGIFRRRGWVWEIHLAPGEPRLVRIPLPHERVDTSSLKELALFLWEPDSARRFELRGMWLR